jgi:4-hydroxy-tetrahydrodipicolinate reductase
MRHPGYFDLPRIARKLFHWLKPLPVVSTCEELSIPGQQQGMVRYYRQGSERQAGAVVGTGVNRGFLMDALPAMLSAVCNHVERIEVRRYQDAQFRRIPFQKKIGGRTFL